MFKSFVDVVKNTMNFISQYEEDDKEEEDNMNYGTYDLSDIYPFKIYFNEGMNLEQLKKKFNWGKIILINNFPDNLKKVPSELIIPSEWPEKGRNLTIGDLLKHNFQFIMERSHPSIFYIHYSTVKGDALGKLMLTDYELIFEPLNKKLKGFIDQQKEDFFSNKKLQFSISYSDLSEQIDICSLPSRKQSNEEIDINYFLQLDVFHTGYYYHMEQCSKEMVDKLKKEKKSLARINLKMNNYSLLDEKITNKQKLDKAKRLKFKMIEKIKLFKDKKMSKTTIPFFDINYKNLLYLVHQNETELTNHQELQVLHKNIHLFEDLFGFEFENPKSLTQINNQSLIWLENVYPEIKEFCNLNQQNLLLLQEKKKKKLKIENLLSIKSDIINNKLAQQISEHFPTVLQGIKWKLIYSCYQDGKSYNTLQWNITKQGELLLVIWDTNDNIFGGLLTHQFQLSSSFFGTGESFLFQIVGDSVKVYNSSFKNSLYCFADEDGFGMGSDNHFGLFINKDLWKGSTHTCQTYLNDPLTPQNHFQIKNLEFWSFNQLIIKYHFKMSRIQSLQNLDNQPSCWFIKSRQNLPALIDSSWVSIEQLEQENNYYKKILKKNLKENVVKSWNIIDNLNNNKIIEIPISKEKNREIDPKPFKVLDAPFLQDDYYLNVLDWSKQDNLAVGLGNSLYLWNFTTNQIQKVTENKTQNFISSVTWNQKSEQLALGSLSGKVQIFDIENLKEIHKFDDHIEWVGACSLRGNLLLTGSRDNCIFMYDLWVGPKFISLFDCHKQEVCGLKWSWDGKYFASGGNDNKLFVFTPKMNIPFMKQNHKAAVKAIGWSPLKEGLLATGAGTADWCLRLFNVSTNSLIQKQETDSQICNLVFSTQKDEIITAHGFSQNEVMIWDWKNLRWITTLSGHTQRVLYLSLSPQGNTIVTGAGDETLWFWDLNYTQQNNRKSFPFKNILR